MQGVEFVVIVIQPSLPVLRWVFSESPDVQESLGWFLHFFQKELLHVELYICTVWGSKSRSRACGYLDSPLYHLLHCSSAEDNLYFWKCLYFVSIMDKYVILPSPPNLIVCTVPPIFRANPWRGAENTIVKYATLALDCFESKAIRLNRLRKISRPFP